MNGGWLVVIAVLASLGAACSAERSNRTPEDVSQAAEGPQGEVDATGEQRTIIEDQAGWLQAAGGTTPPELPAEIAEFVPNYVIRMRTRWTPGQTVLVCFFGGDTVLRGRIRDAALQWTAHGNLSLDFGPIDAPRGCATGNDPHHIRIGFDYAGYWSVVGNIPLRPGTQTMNFSGFDIAPPAEPRFSGVVLHEFGHALGFEHEHQHPDGGCDAEFDWPLVYGELAKPPNTWDTAKVDFNLRSLKERSAYGLSTPDRTSIMHYSLEPWMFMAKEKSKCYVREQFALSGLDREGMAFAYPQQVNLRLTQQRQQIEQLKRSLPGEAVAARLYLDDIANTLTHQLRATRPQ